MRRPAHPAEHPRPWLACGEACATLKPIRIFRATVKLQKRITVTTREISAFEQQLLEQGQCEGCVCEGRHHAGCAVAVLTKERRVGQSIKLFWTFQMIAFILHSDCCWAAPAKSGWLMLILKLFLRTSRRRI